MNMRLSLFAGLAASALGGYASAATYYVSSTTGDDSCTGLSATNYTLGATACPFKTLSKVNSKVYQPADNILFRKGDTFYGTLTASQSGMPGSPITFSSYGSGAKPVLTGFTAVTGWTNIVGNIWESVNNVSALSSVNVVTVNGVNTAMGRWPNSDQPNGGYLTFESHVGTTSIRDNELAGTPDWTGAEVVIRINRWRINRSTITNHSGVNITYTTTDTSEPINNFGYFIQNDSRTLDSQNEWYYNPATRKLQVYSVGQPGSVAAASVNYVIALGWHVNYITIDGLSVEGGNIHGIYFANGANYAVIKNSNVNFSGQDAIHADASDTTIESSTISNSGRYGIWLYNANNSIVRNNLINNTVLIPGLSVASFGAGMYLYSTDGVTIENNVVTNSGYSGIIAYPPVVIRNNLVDTFGLVADDCGGIYSSRNYALTNEISHNIVLNGIGNGNGTNSPGSRLACGIYVDDRGAGYTVSDNTVHNATIGINIHNAHEINIYNNHIFNNGTQIRFQHDNIAPTDLIRNISMSGNVFVAKTSAQLALSYYSVTDDIGQFGTANNNYYARPIDDDQTFTTALNWVPVSRTLAEWRIYSSQDLNSHKSPVSVAVESDMFFDYNATTAPKTITLPYPAIDVTGAKYAATATIAPFSSIILIKDPDPDLTAPTVTGFTIPSAAWSLTVTIAAFTATDNIAIAGYLLTETAVAPVAGIGAWAAAPPTTYTFTSAGPKTIYAWTKDSSGNVSASLQASVTISLSGNLAAVQAYPVPYVPNDDQRDNGAAYSAADANSGIIFDNLPPVVKIAIFSISGQLVAELASVNSGGRLQWNVKNKDGKPAASGGYIAVITSPGQKAVTKKLLVVR